MARVILTQPAPRVGPLARVLREHGHRVLELPARRLVPQEAAAGWAQDLATRRDWVVFVSPGAVEMALSSLESPWPAEVGIAVVGPGSALALTRHPRIHPGVRIARPAEAPFDADALLRTPPFDAPEGLRILVIRGESGRDDWLEALRRRGAQVEVCALYRSEPAGIEPRSRATLALWARERDSVVFVFTAVEAAAHVEALLGGPGDLAWARAQPALAQHPRIARALADLGWAHVVPVEPGDAGLLAGIESSNAEPPRA